MKIQKLILSDFGKFHKEEMKLSPGLNIITGGNESGKTTLRRFIRSMFFGLERDRGIRARQDDYTRYKPWEHGRFQGSMEIEIEGKEYRLFRNFLTAEKQVTLTELATGREIDEPDRFLRAKGIPSETVYVNTFWIGNSCATEGLLAQELRDYLANLAYSGGAGLNLQKSYAWLAARKKELEKELPEKELLECMEIRMHKEECLRRLQEETDAVRRQEKQEEEKRKETDDLEQKVVLLLKECEAAEADRNLGDLGKWYLGLGGGLAVVALGVSFLLPSQAAWICIAGIVILLLGIRLGVPKLVRGRKGREKERELLEQILQMKSRQQQEFEAALELKLAVERGKQKLEQLEEQRQQCELAEQRYAEFTRIRQVKEKEIAAIRLAEETIKRLSAELYEEFGAKFAKDLSSYVTDFTDHAYVTLTAEEDLTLRAVTPDRTVTIPEVSFGTGEQFYLALRFAAADVFDPEKKNPIILDDSFAAFDEQRLESAILALAKCGRQVLLLSSTGREEQAAKRMGIPYETIF